MLSGYYQKSGWGSGRRRDSMGGTMSNNQQSPEPWHAPTGGQQQPYPGASAYPGQQQDTGQQPYPGPPPHPGQQQYPGQQQPYPQPVRQTGKRVISMVLLVIGYVLGGLTLLSVPSVLLGVFADARTESPGYTLGGIIGTLIIPCAFAALVTFIHRWRSRIKRDELRQPKY